MPGEAHSSRDPPRGGGPGMEMWRILVEFSSLGCDFDRLHPRTPRRCGRCWATATSPTRRIYELTIVDNVSLMTELAGTGGGDTVACDSLVVETDVQTDLGLLTIRETARAAAAHGVGGSGSKRVKEGFNPVRSARRGKQTPEKVEAYLGLCRDLVERAEGTVKALVGKGVGEAECRLIRGYIDHARPDRPGRPAFAAGRADSSPGKAFSIFEPHTRWISKGKAGRPVELGVAVCVVEDQYQFILHHLLWKEDDRSRCR